MWWFAVWHCDVELQYKHNHYTMYWKSLSTVYKNEMENAKYSTFNIDDTTLEFQASELLNKYMHMQNSAGYIWIDKLPAVSHITKPYRSRL